MPYAYAIASTVLISLVSLVGLFSLREESVRKHIYLFVSLAVGALLGDAFIHLIPESFEVMPNQSAAGILVVAGILLFFVLEKIMHWHHHAGGEEELSAIHPVGKLVLLSDGAHNFIDGVIIGISFLANVPVGLATTLAVILHEIPQEVGDFAVLLHAGYTKKRALWLNFLSAVTAVFGTLVAFLLGAGGEGLTNWVLPLAAGGFIYVASTDLIPELHKTKSPKQSVLQMAAIGLGVLLMVALVFLE